MVRFAKIGVGAGKNFDASKLSPEMKTGKFIAATQALHGPTSAPERIFVRFRRVG